MADEVSTGVSVLYNNRLVFVHLCVQVWAWKILSASLEKLHNSYHITLNKKEPTKQAVITKWTNIVP